MSRLLCLFAAALAGCPAPGPGPQSPVPPAPTSAGCPAATGVHVASYLTHDAADAGAGHTGWVLPLHDRKVADSGGQADYAAIDPAAAQSLGVPAAPPAVWLITSGQPPCKATVGSYYSAAVDSPVPNITYGVELSGCAAPPQDQQQDAEAIALVSEQPPTEPSLSGCLNRGSG